MKGIYLGLGSNIGDRELHLSNCIKNLISSSKIELVDYSSIYESEPVGFKDQDWFLNAVIKIETKLDAEKLLMFLQNIEQTMGRKRIKKWDSRIIDIDIISYNEQVSKTTNLTIPHPEMHLRKFVLAPLFEINPTFIHPVFKIPIGQMLSKCPDDKVVWFSKLDF